jgi:hypothetical protein
MFRLISVETSPKQKEKLFSIRFVKTMHVSQRPKPLEHFVEPLKRYVVLSDRARPHKLSPL